MYHSERIVDEWTSLPDEPVTAHTPNCFKNGRVAHP